MSVLSIPPYRTKTHNTLLEILDEASQEIIDQALYFREQAPDSALDERWDRAVGRALQSLLVMPKRGATCSFQASELQGVRRLAIPGFPKHYVFYVFLAKEHLVRIIHIIHGSRDLEAFFSDASE